MLEEIIVSRLIHWF